MNNYMDASKIRLTHDHITIKQLILKCENNQRNYSPQEASILIESILLRIPIGNIIIDNSKGNNSIIDGNKRVSIIKDFLDNKFQLTNLEFLQKIKNNDWKSLPRNYQRRLEESYVQLIKIDNGTPNEIVKSLIQRFA